MGKQIDESSITSIVLENESFRISADTFRDILLRVKRKREVEENEISELIKFIITTAEDWRINEIMVVLKENLTNINWIKVYELFDDKKFTISNQRSFSRILECWKCINGENTFPYRIFFKKWNNAETQENFLNYFIESREECLRVYNNVFLTRIITPEDLKRDKLKDDIHLESHFNCLEFFKILKELNQEEMIRRICVTSSEWVFLGLSSVYPFCSKIFDELFLQFLKKERILFLSVIFRNSPALLIKKLAEARDKGFSLNKLLDIILELKILPAILEIMNPSFFCYEILILSSRRDHLNLSIWITNAFKLKKDVFANSLIGYITEKFSRAEQLLKSSIKLDEETTAEKSLYPLTFEITLNILQTLEMLSNSFNREVLQSFNRLKMILPLELKNITEKKLSLEQQSNDFITSVVSGTRTVDQATEIIQSLVNGSLNERELAMKIFSTMLDNYHNFHRISSSKSLAFLFGRLIEKRLFPKFYMQKALRIIANLLKNVTTKEFRFALHTLSMFCDSQRKGEFDAFFEEISKIDKVKEFLQERKRSYVLEDDAIDEIAYDNFMDLLFMPLNGDIVVKLYAELREDQVENVFLRTLKYLMCDNVLNEREIDLDEFVVKTREMESKCIKNIDILIENDIKNDEHITKKINFFDNNSSTCTLDENPQCINQVYLCYLKQVNFSMNNTNLQHFLRYFFEKKIFETNNHFLLLRYFEHFGDDFYSLFCSLVFEMFRYLNKYRIDNEMRFAKSLGQFFGRFTIGMNRLYALDVFNMKEYVIGCVERKRIFFCVIFMVYFIRQGKFGLVFKPKNPFIMNLIYLLNEICEYTKDQLKEEIESLFAELKLTHVKQTSMLVNHVSMDNTTVVFLDSYNLGHFDKVHSKVISMGIDFSIREVTFPLMERIMNISMKTMNFLFRRRKDRKDEYVYDYKRNFMINLIGNLTVVCSLEPMCAAIIGNVPYFLKMAGLEVENERVHAVARNNIEKCNNIIRNAIVTKVLEDLERGPGTKTSQNDLHLLQTAPDVEPTHIEPIKQTEYQEVKEKLSKIQKKQPDKKLEHILAKVGCNSEGTGGIHQPGWQEQ
ncbi:Negative regulator of transcription [Trachipleistophora hominis]|uniref:Negative regulator of transcription n=1 Tax=Trachipleistophora hominis TaxID=72359 RepID=L7JZ47_TRAHO|nr:Negative regulator of transcription [Trachipleistophora hominis]